MNLPLYLKAGIVPVHMTSTNDTDGMGVTVQPKNNQISPIESAYATSIKAKNVAMLVDPSTYTQGMADAAHTTPRPTQPAVTDLSTLERQHIESTLASVGGDKTRAAQLLGISRRTLERRVADWAAQSLR